MATSSTSRKTTTAARTAKAAKKTSSSRKTVKAAKQAKPKKASVAAPRKTPRPDMRAVLGEFGFPTGPGRGMCFLPEDDERFERGYPEMRRLTDEPIDAGRAFTLAENALDAIDPCFRKDIPRAIARPFLLGYRVGPLLFVDRNHPGKNAQLRVERAKLMQSDRVIDEQLLDETLEAHGFGMGDTYSSWRWPKVLYLYEEFIGTEKVARSAAKFLLHAANDLKKWGFAGDDPYRTNAAAHYIALALPWLFRRVEGSVVEEIRAMLRQVPRPEKLPKQSPRAYFALLHWIADPSPKIHKTLEGLEFPLAILRDDAAFVLDRVVNPKWLFSALGRGCWLMGTSLLAEEYSVGGYDLPRLVDQVALFRDPGVVRLMAKIAAQRAGKKAGGDWLEKHADYARPILEKLASLDDEKESKVARAALELVENVKKKGPIVEEPKLDEDALEREIEAIFKKLGERLRAAANRDAEAVAIREAYEAYAEARSAAGDPIPEAYFTHRFGDFGLGKWAMLAVDVID